MGPVASSERTGLCVLDVHCLRPLPCSRWQRPRWSRSGGASPAGPVSAPLPPAPPNPRLDGLKRDVASEVESRRVFTQQLVDSLFSYSELGFQETETQRHLTDTLVREGFDVQRSYAGVPTAWVAKWGSGRPIIALGTDIDGLPTTPTRCRASSRARSWSRGLRATGRATTPHHRRALGEEDHGSGEVAGNARAVAGCGRGSAWLQGALREGRSLQGCRCRAVRPRRERAGHELGRGRRQRHGVGRVHVQRLELARGSGAVAGQERARRRRADGHRLELQTGAPADPAALALRHHQRRRSAQCRAALRIGLVLR